MTLTYRGPYSGLYTYGKEYEVLKETPLLWQIKDDTGVVTNVSKRNNLFWS